MPTVAAALADFLLDRKVQGLAPKTLAWYRTILRGFMQACAGDLADVTAARVRAYLAALQDRQPYAGAPQRPARDGTISRETLAATIRGLKVFWRWAVAEYKLADNPMERIKMPRAVNREPKAITQDDLKLMYQATQPSTVTGKRNRAILLMLADTGCRAGGLISLEMKRLDLTGLKARVVEKGGRERWVPMSALTALAIDDWLKVRPAVAHDVVFVGFRPQTYGAPLTPSGLHQILKGIAKRAGVLGRFNPHAFRHGFAREFLMRGGDLAALAQILGHSSIEVTEQFYARFARHELAQFHRRFTPIRSLLNDDPPGIDPKDR